MSPVLVVLVFITTLVSANAGLIDFNSNDGGFVSSNPLAVGTPWTYSASSANCAGGSGGCWTVPDFDGVSDQRLTSSLFVATGPTSLSFDHSFNLEGGSPNFFDGGVVEISINGGAFTDVVSLFGAFSGQNYTGTISSAFGSPIAGRSAFSDVNTGTFGTYVSSSILLGLNNSDVFQLQWRMATDSSATASSPNGWRLDNINVNTGASAITATPEPGTSGMALFGLAGLVYWLRRKRYRVSA